MLRRQKESESDYGHDYCTRLTRSKSATVTGRIDCADTKSLFVSLLHTTAARNWKERRKRREGQ
jgi:hypothetical protein